MRASTAAACVLALGLAACARPEAPADPAAGARCAPLAPRPPGLLVAGSGSNLAVARALGRRFQAAHGTAVHVPESLGSGGAVRALLDGAIDLGLTSRPLSTAERARGLREVPLARTLVAFVVRRDLPVAALSSAQLADIFGGRRTRWPNGVAIVPLVREAGDSSNQVIAARLGLLGRTLARARREQRFTELHTDQDMRDSLLTVEGAIGYLDLGTLSLEGLPLVPLALDGIAPTREHAASGRYPLVKTLYFVTRGEPSPKVRAFLAFAKSDAARNLLAEAGYLP